MLRPFNTCRLVEFYPTENTLQHHSEVTGNLLAHRKHFSVRQGLSRDPGPWIRDNGKPQAADAP